MYNKFLNMVYAADSQLDEALFQIQRELKIELQDGQSVNFCTFSKESDDTYTMYFRYFPGVELLNLINKSYKSIPFISNRIQLGRILVDTSTLKNPIVESETIGRIQVEGYLEALGKEEFNFANDLLDYISKSLQDILKDKYVVTYKKPFDIKKEVRQVNDRWKGTSYDAGIYKVIEKIQSFCRMFFINSLKDYLVENNICTLIGFRKYQSVIMKEYSTVSDAYFESREFKEKVDAYVYELNVQKTSNENFEADLESKLLSATSDRLQLSNFAASYIESIKRNGDFGVNEFPLTSFEFTPEIQSEVKSYIDGFISNVFSKRSANLYNEFFTRIAISKEEMEELKNKSRAEKEFIKFEDLLSEEEKQSLQDLTTPQEEQKQSEEVENKVEKSPEDKSSLSEQVDDSESMSMKEAIMDFANESGYKVEFKEGSDKPSSVYDSDGKRVNVTDFLNTVMNEYNVSSDNDSKNFVSTSIYDKYLTPESYSQFHSAASLILAQLANINSSVDGYIKDIKEAQSGDILKDTYNKIKKLIINASDLPAGIQKSLLVALNVSNARVALDQLQVVLDVQIQIIKIFVEDTDYKAARGRVNAILNEYRDLSKYFNNKVENFNVQQNVEKVVKETKDKPYLLAKKFRIYLKKLGWKYNAKDLVFYKGKEVLSEEDLKKLLDEFNKANNSNLKFEDIFTQRSLQLEPIDIIVKDNSLTRSLFKNIDEIATNSGIKSLNNKLDALSLEIKNL